MADSMKTISSLKIAKAVSEVYRTNAGITDIFDWQYECLTSTGVFSGKNLVFSAPTSAGKTLVAELVMIKRILETNKKCIFILPFVSVVREKVYYMKKLFKTLGIRVEGFMGAEQPNGGLKVCDVAICTIEKANSLVNRLISDNSLACLGMIIVDELHMVGDSSRGYLLELLLTKLMFIMKQKNSGELCHVQILGMSATLPNLDVVAHWLDAALYSTDYRPVPLQECLKIDKHLINKEGSDETIQNIPKLNVTQIVDEDDLIALCYETVSQYHSVLIFCPTKVRCEKLTISIAKGFHFILETSMESLEKDQKVEMQNFQKSIEGVRKRYQDITMQLKNCPVGLDKVLNDTMFYGVAYHHAGLTFDERDVIEAGFRTGALRVLIATSTLSSGVNLPARRVIIRTPVFNGSLLDTLTYKQMCGRAGRKGVDDFGQSILICKPTEKAKGHLLLNSNLQKVSSCLNFSSGVTNALKRALLEIIAAGIARTEGDLKTYFESTLLHSSSVVKNGSEESSRQIVLSGFADLKAGPVAADANDDPSSHPVNVCVNYLENYEFIRFTEVVDLDADNGNSSRLVQESDRLLYPTQLGVAALSSSFPPHQSLLVFAELQRARRNFCLDDDLHLVYLVTPLYCFEVSANMEWMNFMSLLEALPVSSKRIAKLVGVEESFITRAIRGNINMNSPADRSKVDVHKRFYSALVLSDLINEVPLNEVSKKYSVSRGQLQTLQQSAGTFAGMVTVFCNRLGWKNLSMLLRSFQTRLNFGIHQELIELVRISVLNAQRARILFSAGYHTVVHLANADVGAIEQVLRNRNPFKSKRKSETAKLNNAESSDVSESGEKKIWVLGAKKAISEKEAAAVIIGEAKQLVVDDLRLMGINLLSDVPQQNKTDDHSFDDTKGNDIQTENKTERRKSRFSMLETSLFNTSKSRKIPLEVTEDTKAENRKQRSRNRSGLKSLSKSQATNEMTAAAGSSPEPPPAKRPSFELSKEEMDGQSKNMSFLSANQENVSVFCSQYTSNLSINRPEIPKNFGLKNCSAHKHHVNSGAVEKLTQLNVSNEVQRRSLSTAETSFRFEDIEMSSTPFMAKGKFGGKTRKKLNNAFPTTQTNVEQQENYLEGNNSLIFSASNKSVQKISQKRNSLNDSVARDSVLSDAAFLPTIPRKHLGKTASADSAILRSESIVCNSNEVSVSSFKCMKPFVEVQKNSQNISNKTHTPNQTDSLIYFVNKPLNESSGALSRCGSFSQLESELTSDLSCLALQSPCIVETKHLEKENQKRTNNFNNFGDLHCSQELLFQDEEELPPNQLNRRISDSKTEVSVVETKSLPFFVNSPAPPFEPSENSLLMDSELLTQVVVDSMEPRSSFCEEPVEAVTPQKEEISIDAGNCYHTYGGKGLEILKISHFGRFRSKVVQYFGFISVVLHLSRPCTETEVKSDEIETLQQHDGQDAGNRIFFCFDDDCRKVFFSDFGSDEQLQSKEGELKSLLNLMLVEYENQHPKTGIVCFDGKKLFKAFGSLFKLNCKVPVFDVGLSNWVLHCNEKDMMHSGIALCGLISRICPNLDPIEFLDQHTWERLSNSRSGFFVSPDADCNVEIGSFLAYVALELHSKLMGKITSSGLHFYLSSIESKTQLINHDLERTGFKFDCEKFEKLRSLCIDRCQLLEEKAHKLVGKEFDLTSPDDVSFVLYFDLKLPPNGEVESLKPSSNYQKALGLRNSILKSRKRNGKLKLPPEFNTRNETLTKLIGFHEVPGIVIEHRKVLFALSRMTSIAKVVCEIDGRVKPKPDSLSATGRMSFKEPNIQNTSKPFPIMDLSPTRGRVNLRSQRRRSQTSSESINCRALFIAESGCVLIGADYSQLELRLLAHFSGDETLLSFLNDGGDVFKSIAGFWREKEASLITNEERQSAKEMCYGIVYGMGAKSLAEQLKTNVETAEMFIRSFRLAFPALFAFVTETVEFCQEHDFIETLNGRRRYLPDINNGSRKGLKAHAERQAVNSRIQGSASEILKEALVSIRQSLVKNNFEVSFGHNNSRELRRFCLLVLHLHDEVIYEVRKEDSLTVAGIVKTCMEQVKHGKLKVKLPVKLKSGPSWGEMTDFDVNS